MDQDRPSGLWIAFDPMRVGKPLNGLGAYSYSDPFEGANWSDVSNKLTKFKIFSSTIYNLSRSGYTKDISYARTYYPTQSHDLLNMLEDLTQANGESPSGAAGSNGIPIYMESGVLPPGTLDSGAQYTSGIEGFDPSFQSIFSYMSAAFTYDIAKGFATLDQIKSVEVRCVAMDEPLYFGSVYQSPQNYTVSGVKSQAPQWSIPVVASKAVAALAAAKHTLGILDPGLQFGDIEPVPLVTAEQVGEWVHAYHDAAVLQGLPAGAQQLAFFQADVVWGLPGWQTTLESISATLDQSAIPLDVIIDGYGNETSVVTWTDHALNGLVSIYLDPKIHYSSLSIQNWDQKAPATLFDSSQTDKSAGSLSNTARYATVISDVYHLYQENFPGANVSSYDLYYSTRMVGNDIITLDQLAADLRAASAYEHSIATSATLHRALPGVTELLGGNTAGDLAEPSPDSSALNFVPTGMTLEAASWFFVPGESSQDINLTNMANGSAIGNMYLYGGSQADSSRQVMLPDGTVAVISVLPSQEAGPGTASLLGGSTADFIYLATGLDTFSVGNSKETVVDATGTNNSLIMTSSENASSTFIGAAGTTAHIEVVDGGTFRPGILSNHAVFTLDAPSSISLPANSDLAVVIPSANFGCNSVSITSAKQSVLNFGGSTVLASATSASASAKINGGAAGALLEVTTGGSLLLAEADENLTVQIDARSYVKLNSAPDIRVLVPASNSGMNTFGLGAAGQTIVVGNGRYSCVFASTTHIGGTTGTSISSGGAGQLNLYNGGNASLGSDISGLKYLFLYRGAADPGYFLTLSASQSNVGIYDTRGGDTILISSPAQSVHNLGTDSVHVIATAENASAAIIDNGSGAVLEVTTGGTVAINSLDHGVMVQLDQPSSIYLYHDALTKAVVPVGNPGSNTFGLGAAGQSITVNNDHFSCVFAPSAYIGGFTGTIISAGGHGQLNIYNGGSVALGNDVTGLKSVFLYRGAADTKYDLSLSSAQNNVTVYDAAGGSTVSISDSSQSVKNCGAVLTRVIATAASSGATIIGNANADTVLEVSTGGKIVLGSTDDHLIVKLDAPSMLTLNGMQFITADAVIGHSTVVAGAAGQTIQAGAGDTIVDTNKFGVTLVGTAANLNQNTIQGYNFHDIIHITDFSFPGLSAIATPAHDGTTLSISSGSATVNLALLGFTPAGTFNISSDDHNGSFVTYSHS